MPVQLAGVDPPSAAVVHVPGQRMQLLDLQQALPDARPQRRLGQVAEQILSLVNPTQVTIGRVEAASLPLPGAAQRVRVLVVWHSGERGCFIRGQRNVDAPEVDLVPRDVVLSPLQGGKG